MKEKRSRWVRLGGLQGWRFDRWSVGAWCNLLCLPVSTLEVGMDAGEGAGNQYHPISSNKGNHECGAPPTIGTFA